MRIHNNLFKITNLSMILLFVIVLLAFYLRIYKISTIPASLNPDEVALGYTSFAISTTGLDEHGQFLPLSLLSFGDGKLPVYPYLGMIPVAIMGLSETSVRLPSVIAGVLGTILLYFIAKEIFRKEEYGLLASFFFAVSPWSIYFSRMAYEVNLATTIFLGGLFAFLKYQNNQQKKMSLLIISALLFGITIFTYHAHVFFTPIFSIGLLVLYRKHITRNNVFIFISLLAIFIFLAYLSILKGSFYKASSVGIFNNKDIIYNRVERLRGDNSSENPIFGKVIHNKYLGVSYQILQNYLASLSPTFLFDKGGEKLMHTLGTFGNLYLFDALLLFIGFAGIFWHRENFLPLLICWLVLGPIPSAITEDAPNSARLFIIMPILVLVSSYGAWQIILFLKKKSFLGFVVLIGLTCLFFLNLIFFLDAYFIHMNIHRARFLHYGYREAVWLSQKYPNYKVVMRGPENFPYIYFLFYEKYDNRKFIKSVEYYPATPEGFYFVKKFGRYEFPKEIDYEKTQRKTLYIDDTRLNDKSHSILLPSGESILGYFLKE